MGFQQDYQYYFQTMSKDSFVIEYLLLPIILFLIIILIYSYIKKKLLRDEKEDLESLKLLMELLDSVQLMKINFKRKKPYYFKMVNHFFIFSFKRKQI